MPSRKPRRRAPKAEARFKAKLAVLSFMDWRASHKPMFDVGPVILDRPFDSRPAPVYVDRHHNSVAPWLQDLLAAATAPERS